MFAEASLVVADFFIELVSLVDFAVFAVLFDVLFIVPILPFIIYLVSDFELNFLIHLPARLASQVLATF